jgi:hypothetical protein
MFMWMLRDGIVKFSKCSCKCYMMALSNSNNVYVNVTRLHCQVLKMFMWMLHGCIAKFSKCWCECYTVTISSSLNVYVNVTWWQYQVLKMFMWMLQDGIVNYSKCLCKCFIVVLILFPSTQIVYENVTWYSGLVLILFPSTRIVFMRMLHDILIFWVSFDTISKHSNCLWECYMMRVESIS